MTVNIDGRDIIINEEKNLLELIRKAQIALPTFCYHSELSVYGACRLCIVDVEGRGIQPACSTPPQAGMQVRTNTRKIRDIRKIIVELLLANGNHDCTTCPRSGTCRLQELAKKLGVKEIRYKKTVTEVTRDLSTESLARDPSKCVLCGDCVRMCGEVQGIGAIDFAYRGKDATVIPACDKDLDDGACIYCGQCARVCPTGSITVKSHVSKVWDQIYDPDTVVVAQIAPAVRVALGEEFGMQPGTTTTGQLVSALKRLGFDMVFDTSFTADLTVIEEGKEFINRLTGDEKLPLLTSCCPAWVKYVEQTYPEFIGNLSTCKSPQGMFGSIAKTMLPDTPGMEGKRLVVVSIMPCTAKKYEASREELATDGIPDVDYVLTTQEIARMIDECGLDYKNLPGSSFDQPYGFKTGAGIIFGNSGGVSEAVLRYVTEQLEGKQAFTNHYTIESVRGNTGIKELTKTINGKEVKLAVVSGLANAQKLIEKIKTGKAHYDLIEVMACPGGCIGGAGQPYYTDKNTKSLRTKGLYENDTMMQLHKSQDNPYIVDLYRAIEKREGLGNSADLIHHLLHTGYQDKKEPYITELCGKC